jgi:hypothetical protein
MEEVQVRVSALGTEQTAAQLRQVKQAAQETANPAAYRTPAQAQRLEKEITLTSELEMAELRRAGNHAAANKIAEELELMREQTKVQATLNTSDEQSLAIAKERLAVRRAETEAREAAVVAARGEAAADMDDVAMGGGAGGGGGGLRPSALRGGRLGSIGRFLGLAPEIANPLGMAVMAAMAAAVANRASEQEMQSQREENSNRGLEIYKQETAAGAELATTASTPEDRAVAAKEVIDDKAKLLDLQQKAAFAKPDQLPFSAWFTNFSAKANQFWHPNDGPSTERDQLQAQIADLTNKQASDAAMAKGGGPMTGKGRRWMQIYDELTGAGDTPQAASAVAEQNAGRGDFNKFGSATRGGARLAMAAGHEMDKINRELLQAVTGVSHAITGAGRQPGHVNPNARVGPGGPVSHAAAAGVDPRLRGQL